MKREEAEADRKAQVICAWGDYLSKEFEQLKTLGGPEEMVARAAVWRAAYEELLSECPEIEQDYEAMVHYVREHINPSGVEL